MPSEWKTLGVRIKEEDLPALNLRLKNAGFTTVSELVRVFLRYGSLFDLNRLQAAMLTNYAATANIKLASSTRLSQKDPNSRMIYAMNLGSSSSLVQEHDFELVLQYHPGAVVIAGSNPADPIISTLSHNNHT
jgi:hypothetical protein